MKIRNYVSQKILKTTTSLLVLALGLLLCEMSNAQACKLEKHNLAADSAALMEKIKSEISSATPTSGFIKASYSPNSTNVLDHKFHNIDRTLPYFQDMNGIGILTGNTFANKPQTYGSATLIGSCYIVTNKHVVKALLDERGQSLKTGESFNFSVGQPKDCSSKDQFELMNQQATLVDVGNETNNAEDGQSDWAVLKLKKPITHIKAVNTKLSDYKSDQMLVRGGYYYDSVKMNGGFSKLSGQYMQNLGYVAGGTGKASDEGTRNGMSGGGVFFNKFVDGVPTAYLAGISIGNYSDGTTAYLPTQTLRRMIKKSGKLNWNDLIDNTASQNCN